MHVFAGQLRPAVERETDGEESRAVCVRVRVRVCVCVCVFGGGTPSFKEVRSSWLASEEGREAEIKPSEPQYESLSHFDLLLPQ